ncbi:hypothetical protein ACPD8N_03480 [Lacticaseibacillus chiayiensis]|uniref:AbrB/MazE/SpoVT family DNA-binding domain-containing protein n=1 Tax=Lacticaseibacillus chiayiensis TaxID=2100821 RepID=UPI003C736D0E
MQIKTRKQGNSLTLIVPKEFNIAPGQRVVPKLRANGIFYRFVEDKDDFFDFSTDVLKSLVAQGLTGNELVSEFNRQKHAISASLSTLANDYDVITLSRKELKKKIGL